MTKSLITEKAHGGGWITLNRPQALNALNLEMFEGLSHILQLWKSDPEINYVVLQGAGRAFCAGGDIRSLYDLAIADKGHMIVSILVYEFHLNEFIHNFSKPYISVIDGICMGGGMGVSIHGSYRIITENSLMAMPETSIGYFPDIGAAWFFNQCPGKLGLYLALTGYRMKPEDAIYSGLATHYVDASYVSLLLDNIRQSNSKNLSDVLTTHNKTPEGPHFLEKNREEIDLCFNQTSIEAIFQTLAKRKTVFAEETLATLKRMCPLSLRKTYEHMQYAKNKSIHEVIEADVKLITYWQGHDDYLREWVEGIRAAVVDKDRNPQWKSTPIAY